MVAFLHFGCHVASEHAQRVYHIASMGNKSVNTPPTHAIFDLQAGV